MNRLIKAVTQTVKRPGYHILSVLISLMHGGSLYFYGSDMLMIISGILMMYSLTIFVIIPLLDNVSLRFGENTAGNRLLPVCLSF